MGSPDGRRRAEGPRASDSPLEADDSTELLGRLQQGDSSAWETLYLRHHDALLFAIRCRLGSGLRQRLASEDILHSVVADVLSDIQRFEARGPGSLQRWLSTCVLNKLRSKAEYFAAGKRAGDDPLSDSLAARLGGPSGEEPRYVDPEPWESLERSLLELDEAHREVVLSRTIDGLSNAEAAERVGKSREATSKLYNRAIARLGARLATLQGGATSS
jgi:RNA polymerase sigma-70 factor (ECF subfamily)